MAYSPTLATHGIVRQRRCKRDWGRYIQLPPHTKMDVSFPDRRSTCRLSLENSANQAVAEAKGTVAASAGVIDCGTLKLMDSLAMEYWLYAPSPLISPASVNRRVA
jgi:hypothetical protein